MEICFCFIVGDGKPLLELEGSDLLIIEKRGDALFV